LKFSLPTNSNCASKSPVVEIARWQWVRLQRRGIRGSIWARNSVTAHKPHTSSRRKDRQGLISKTSCAFGRRNRLPQIIIGRDRAGLQDSQHQFTWRNNDGIWNQRRTGVGFFWMPVCGLLGIIGAKILFLISASPAGWSQIRESRKGANSPKIKPFRHTLCETARKPSNGFNLRRLRYITSVADSNGMAK
jgi:hypothetical protein